MASHKAFCILMLLLISATAIFADCGFASTCNNIGFSGTTLQANCRTKSGAFRATSINTNSCFGNSNGRLVCGAAYANSCSNIGYSRVGSSSFIGGRCRSTSGQSVQTAINLSQCVANQDGVLACCS